MGKFKGFNNNNDNNDSNNNQSSSDRTNLLRLQTIYCISKNNDNDSESEPEPEPETTPKSSCIPIIYPHNVCSIQSRFDYLYDKKYVNFKSDDDNINITYNIVDNENIKKQNNDNTNCNC